MHVAYFPPPHDIAEARRVLINPTERTARHVSAWCFLKEARGQKVDLQRLYGVSALFEPVEVLPVTRSDGTAAILPVHLPPREIEAAMIRALPRTREAIRRFFGRHDPEGAW